MDINTINGTTIYGQEYRDAIFEVISGILQDKLGLFPTDIKYDSHFQNDLGADSLDCVELIMEVEKTFDIAIPDHEAENLFNVNETVEYLYRRRNDLGRDGVKNLRNSSYAIKENHNIIDHSNDEFLHPIETDEQVISGKKFLTEIRRFELKENWSENDIIVGEERIRNNIVKMYSWGIGLKGDIFEEIIDRPNCFVNVTKLKREGKFYEKNQNYIHIGAYINILGQNMNNVRNDEYYLNNIDILEAQLQNNIRIKKTFDNLRPINVIEVKDSELLNDLNYNLNPLRNSYKRKLKMLAQLNEEIADLEGIFKIEKE
jgi:acyl carrier protein